MNEIDNLGIKLKTLRKSKGLTQKQLAEKCSLSESIIRKYENDQRKPKLETLFLILEKMDSNLKELFGPWETDYYKYLSEVYKKQIIDRDNLLNTTLEGMIRADDCVSGLMENLLNIEHKPEYLLNAILTYLGNTENFYVPFAVDLHDDSNKPSELKYLSQDQVNNMVNNILEYVKFEVHKFEENESDK